MSGKIPGAQMAWQSQRFWPPGIARQNSVAKAFRGYPLAGVLRL